MMIRKSGVSLCSNEGSRDEHVPNRKGLYKVCKVSVEGIFPKFQLFKVPRARGANPTIPEFNSLLSLAPKSYFPCPATQRGD